MMGRQMKPRRAKVKPKVGDFASGATECENMNYEDTISRSRHEKAGRKTSPVAKGAQHTGEGGRGAPKSASGSSGPVHGVRERTGEYGSSEDPSEKEVGSTRYFETAEGTFSYTEVSERLALALGGILQQIIETTSEQIIISPECCSQHQKLAGHLFPEWAGRYRTVNVQIGSHTPPPFYEVPTLTRLFCDDLGERLRHVSPLETNIGEIAELLGWADWRFQWIHPFKDFNGRIGRVLLAAILYKLFLPHVETAPLDPHARRQYLEALRAADHDNLQTLTDLWVHRIAKAL
jgi:fido (protein-threonine AMPylation protein)